MPSDEENLSYDPPKELWLRAWHDTFTTLLKWGEPKIREFVAKWESRLNDGDSMFWHEDPAYWVTYEVIKEVFGEDPCRYLGHEQYRKLDNELYSALSHGWNVRQAVESRNWQEKRAVVADILAPYGGRLP